MPKLKRVSENQLNKDLYDADPDDRFAETPDPGRGMTKASSEVMQRRKIVKVSRRKFGGGGGTAGAVVAPKIPAASQQQKSSNPFASTTLAKPTQSTTGECSAKANPFASVSFSSSTNSTPAALPKFSFAGSTSTNSTSTAATPKPFSFSTNTSSTTSSQPTSTATAPKQTTFATPKHPRHSSSTTNNLNMQTRELNENLLKMIVDHWEGHQKFSDYSVFMKEYQTHSQALKDMENEEAEDGESNTAVGNSAANLSAPNSNSQSALPFSFGGGTFTAAAPSAASPAAAAPTSMFSFTSKQQASAAPAAPPALSFSFGGAATASTATAKSASLFSAPSSTSASNDDDPTSNPDDGKIEKIEQEANTQETILLEVRAKHLKLEKKGGWKKFGAGVLRVYKHNETSKHRVVIRNEIGKVQFNVGISNGMKFDKVIKDGKKGKAAYVKFCAVEDASKGLESFMIQLKPESVDKLHDTLTKAAE